MYLSRNSALISSFLCLLGMEFRDVYYEYHMNHILAQTEAIETCLDKQLVQFGL